jgi:universal stress protein A
MKLEKILIPTDFSPSAERALGFAVELALKLDASLSIVHVYNFTPYEIPEGMPVSGLINVDRVIGEFQKLLDAAKRRAEQAGVARVETILVPGTAYSEIARLAEQHGSGLIVMGTHGRTGFAHLMLGSVAEKVVRRAPCPVITVPLREANRKQA